MRTVQRGTSPDLVILYLVGPHIDTELRRVLGEEPWIVALTEPRGVSPKAIADHLGMKHVRSCVLCGYSAGCMGVRDALRSGDLPVADRLGIITIDGTHASKPPEDWQIRIWHVAAEQARRSENLFVATCTAQTYVEHLPAGQAFLSTLTVLRCAIDSTLVPQTPPDERHEGDLHVYAFGSKDIDKNAHIAQQRDVLPKMLEQHVRPWLWRAAGVCG